MLLLDVLVPLVLDFLFIPQYKFIVFLLCARHYYRCYPMSMNIIVIFSGGHLFLPIVMGSWWALHLGKWDCRIFPLIFLL